MDGLNLPDFMPATFEVADEKTNDQAYKITYAVSKMDDEIKDRFKALYAIQSVCQDFNE